jgi:DnaJ-class molecular chaperone
MTPDPYRTLGVTKNATPEQIKSAYRRLARENHPDTKPGDKTAENRFKIVANAYSLLSDPAKRRRFDAGEIDANGNAKPGFGASRPKANDAGSDGYDTYKRNTSSGGFGFGFNAGKASDAKPGGDKKSRFNSFFRDKPSFKAKGADVSYTLKVPLSDAALGAEKTVRMTTGKTLRVTIPPGTENGKILRLKHQGMAGLGGGAAGDALVEILIEQSGEFTADGLDIHCEEPVTLPEAILGARIEVRTVHGPVLVTVPEGSNTGTILRLKGKGVHRTNATSKTMERGDHYVTLRVVLPKTEDGTLKAFVKKWAAKNPYSVRKESLKRTAAE